MGATKKEKVKSASERLRGVYYNLWKQDDQGFEEFEDFYNSKMELLITHFKRLIKN
mgnify:CR=1 FL=1|tara:strand:- start:9621 stop:9788 length:168 start_codon:yes stop_codon:yes gene_type:complete